MLAAGRIRFRTTGTSEDQFSGMLEIKVIGLAKFPAASAIRAAV
jgi:hypothetical protein